MKDREIKSLINAEKKRQKSVINLIASENYVSKDVLRALGSILNNKYAEGYPGKRYYGGNSVIDKVERLCQKRALETFGLIKNDSASEDKIPDSSNSEDYDKYLSDWSVNVQAMSGSPANFAVFTAILSSHNLNNNSDSNARRGKIMGLSLDHGGHLTHGQKVSVTSQFWDSVLYGVDQKTETLDYEKLYDMAKLEKPDIIIAGYTAYPRIVDWKKMREIADSCEAILMVDMSHISGLVAGGVYPSPFPFADIVTTTTHKTLRGPRSALIFSRKKALAIKNSGDEKYKNLPKKIDKAIFPGLQGGPHENQIAAVAVALKEAQNSNFKKYAEQVVKNAKVLSEELSLLGWRIVSGGTDSHLLLVDVWNNGKKNEKGVGGISGKEAEEKLEKAGIIVNKNTIPFDPRTPLDPSGIRLGTAAETTRGKNEKDFKKIAEKIDSILRS